MLAVELKTIDSLLELVSTTSDATAVDAGV